MTSTKGIVFLPLVLSCFVLTVYRHTSYWDEDGSSTYTLCEPRSNAAKVDALVVHHGTGAFSIANISTYTLGNHSFNGQRVTRGARGARGVHSVVFGKANDVVGGGM